MATCSPPSPSARQSSASDAARAPGAASADEPPVPMSRRICIDARKLADFGIGTYIRNLLRSLAEIDRTNHYWILVGRDHRAFVERLGRNFHAFTETSSVYSMRELATVSYALRRLRPDVYHAT